MLSNKKYTYIYKVGEKITELLVLKVEGQALKS